MGTYVLYWNSLLLLKRDWQQKRKYMKSSYAWASELSMEVNTIQMECMTSLMQ